MNTKLHEQLQKIGIQNVKEIFYNPSYDFLYEQENSSDLVGFERVQNTEFGAVNVMTGIFTGRSPKDKYILKDETTKSTLWWTSDSSKNDNKPINKEVWDNLSYRYICPHSKRAESTAQFTSESKNRLVYRQGPPTPYTHALG